MRSKSNAKSMCSIPFLGDFGNNSVITLLFDIAASVAAPMNSSPDLDIATCTCAPSFVNDLIISHDLYAAIDPVIQRRIFLFLNYSSLLIS